MTCDFSGGSMTTLRVRKSTSSVEPTGSNRRMIGRSSRAAVAVLPDDRVRRSSRPPRARGLGEHQVADGHVRDRWSRIVEPAPGRSPPAAGRARGAVRRRGGELSRRRALGEREGDLLGARVADLVEIDLLALTDHSAASRPTAATVSLVEVQLRVARRSRLELLVGQLDAVAVELGERDREARRARRARATSIGGPADAGFGDGWSEGMNANGTP